MSVAHLLDSIREQGAFFAVKTEPVKTGSGRVIPGKKVHCLEDGTPIGVTSTKYRTVTTEEIFDKFGKALDVAGIDTEGATARVNFANDGARTMVRMRFPAYEIVPASGDASILEICTKNSYDGRWNFSVRGGACRMACLNGMLLGDWIAAYSEYHNSKLSVERAAEKLASIITGFEDTTEHWQRMLQSPVTDEKAWRAICLYTTRTKDFKRGLAAYAEATQSDRQGNVATKLYEHWDAKEKKDIGPNAFSVYNALTHDATHASLTDGKEAISLDLRAARVQKVLQSKYWNERVLAA